MKNIRLLVVLLLAFGVVSAGLSVTNYTISKNSFAPGDSGVILLVVSNPMLSTGVGYKMTGVAVSYFPPPEITTSGVNNIGDIDAGGYTLVSVPIKISKNAKSGIYLFEIKLTGYSVSSTTTGQDVYAKTVSIPITITNQPILTFSPDKKVVSGIDTVTFEVSNKGGAAKNVRIKTSSTSAISLYGIDELYVSELKDKSFINVTLDSRNVTDGPVNLVFEVTYEDEVGTSATETNTLRVTVKKDILDLAFTQQSTIITRKDGNLTLKIKNNGEELKDVRLTFGSTALRMKEVSEVKIGDIAAAGETIVSTMVFADMTPGLNLVPTKISWVEKDIRKEQTVNVPITITSDTDVSVYLESKPTPITVGKEHTVSVLVSNIGSYAIDNVDVVFYSNALQSLDVSSSQYIGSLDRDDFSTVQFKTKCNALIPGEYDAFVNITYRDKSGEWKTKTIQKRIVVYSSQQGDGSLYILIAVVAALALIIWFFKFRKKGVFVKHSGLKP